jgi:transposase
MTSAGYTTLIILVMHNFLHAHPELASMQDYSGPHTGSEVQQELGARRLMLMERPPSSPDLDPIKNIWHLIKQRI